MMLLTGMRSIAAWIFFSISLKTSVRALSHSTSSTPTTTASFSSTSGTHTALTSAVLKVTYDGSLFNGWTASNEGVPTTNERIYQPRRYGKARRNKHRPSVRKGEVRSVEGALKGALSKIYGNVPLDRIVIEGCSRTDKGVHSKGSPALIYCLLKKEEGEDSADQSEDDSNSTSDGGTVTSSHAGSFSIAGKNLPHPTSPTDKDFKELPFKSDVRKMLFTLNKMLPPDVRVLDASPFPTKEVLDDGGSGDGQLLQRPFHPSLDSVAKTYRYTFSLGEIHDPIRCRDVWNIPYCTKFDLDRAKECAQLFVGEQDFIAFRGAFRGNERGKVQNTICCISDLIICDEGTEVVPFPLCKTYYIEISGDRFLYKMVRFLVGTIVQYATTERISLEDVKNALATGRWNMNHDEHELPRFCAPPNGLSLKCVHYDMEWMFDWMFEQKVSQLEAKEVTKS